MERRFEILQRIVQPLQKGILRCSLCGGEIAAGECYWYCNGASICGGCLGEFARTELAPYRQIRGEEEAL